MGLSEGEGEYLQVARFYSAVQKCWSLMHDEPSALSNQLIGCQRLKAEGFLLGKAHPFRERL
jgi:hypothetical protein